MWEFYIYVEYVFFICYDSFFETCNDSFKSKSNVHVPDSLKYIYRQFYCFGRLRPTTKMWPSTLYVYLYDFFWLSRKKLYELKVTIVT